MSTAKGLNILFFNEELKKNISNEILNHNLKCSELTKETKKELIKGMYNIVVFNLENAKEREFLKELKNIKNIQVYKIGVKKNTSIKNIEDYSLGLDKIQTEDSIDIKEEIVSYRKTFLINYELNCNYLSLIKEISKSKIYLKNNINKNNKKISVVHSTNPSILTGEYLIGSDTKGTFLMDEFSGSNIVRFGKVPNEKHLDTINKKVLVYSNKGYSGRLPYSSVEIFSCIEQLMKRMKEDFDTCFFEYSNENKVHQKNLAWKMKETFNGKKMVFFNSKGNYGFDFVFFKKSLTDYIKDSFSDKKFIEDGIIKIKTKISINNISLTEATIFSNEMSFSKGDFIEVHDPFYLTLKVDSCKKYNNLTKYNCLIEGMSLESRKKILRIVDR